MKKFIEFTKPLWVAAIAAFIVLQFVLVNATVPTGSMLPTIQCGDRIMFTRFSYWFQGPQRGDIVVFRYPDDRRVLFVKRVAALPNETIEIKNSKVYIDNEYSEQMTSYCKNAVGNFGPYTVPENSYFMLGDNRNNSLDSRFWANTFVPKDDILGKMAFKYWPLFN